MSKAQLLSFLALLLMSSCPTTAFVLQQHRISTHPLQMCDFFDNFMNQFTSPNQTANASHILMDGPDASRTLQDLKSRIGNDPIQFSDAAAKYSTCPSASKGGNLGDFGRGDMAKEFDQVVFKDAVGVVHGPVQTKFGYHLILINERSSG